MKNKGKIFSRIVLMSMFYIFSCLFLFNSPKLAYAQDTVLNPFKEIFSVVRYNSIGMNFMYDLDKQDYAPCFKWTIGSSPHKWIFWGITAKGRIDNEQVIAVDYLGFSPSFNLGKLLEEKILKTKLQFVDHLEIGYTIGHDFRVSEIRNGLLIGVIKKEF
ncbi:MAG TPA: hypothetical protein PLJ44_09565 [Victivallales bacterium]|nr:hypothetical protein [Victivallales bacterium]